MLAAFTGHPFLAELALRDWAAEQGIDRTELSRLTLEEADLQTLEPLLSPGLFGGGGVLLDMAGGKPEKALLELLASATAPVLVLDGGAPATRNKFYEASGTLVKSPAPRYPRDTVAWLLPYAQRLGLQLERGAATYLAETFGDDLGGIAGELNKLKFLPEGTRLDEPTVAEVVGRERAGDSFAMLDAATAGHTAQALEQLGRLLRGSEDPFKLLGVVVWQYSLIARCVGLLEAKGGRVSDSEAAERLGTSPYPTKKALNVARRLSEAKVRAHLERILAADLALKRGQDPTRVLERLLVGLSSR